jgi:hypothetical protein
MEDIDSFDMILDNYTLPIEQIIYKKLLNRQFLKVVGNNKIFIKNYKGTLTYVSWANVGINKCIVIYKHQVFYNRFFGMFEWCLFDSFLIDHY